MGVKGMVFTLLLVTVVQSVAKIIDLSHVHTEKTFMSPSNDHYKHKIVFSGEILPGIYNEYGKISSGEHGGTHLDAPVHFFKDGKYIHELPLEYTILDGVMIDCSKDVNGNASYVMPLKKLEDWEKEHGEIPKGAAVIVNFGWSDRFNDSYKYVKSNDLSDLSTYTHPVVSPEAGTFLAKERDAKLLGVDSMGPDLIGDKFPIHIIFLEEGRLIVENVRDPSRLPARGFRLHASPVKFFKASGCQIRLYAMTYDEDPGNGQGRQSFPGWLVVIVCLMFAMRRTIFL